jgi:hypothetical protein
MKVVKQHPEVCVSGARVGGQPDNHGFEDQETFAALCKS